MAPRLTSKWPLSIIQSNCNNAKFVPTGKERHLAPDRHRLGNGIDHLAKPSTCWNQSLIILRQNPASAISTGPKTDEGVCTEKCHMAQVTTGTS
jgi:hypothetical protein